MEEDGFNAEPEIALRLIYTEIFQKPYHVSNKNLIVYGEPVSGKSRLINGVSKLFRSLFPLKYLKVTATTGTAAFLLKSPYIHKFIGWNFFRRQRQLDRKSEN